MRRKKLANKIVSILMAGMMVASTPMSALAVDVDLTEAESVIEQSVSEEESSEEAIAEETDTDEELADEEITIEEDADQGDLGGHMLMKKKLKS